MVCVCGYTILHSYVVKLLVAVVEAIRLLTTFIQYKYVFNPPISALFHAAAPFSISKFTSHWVPSLSCSCLHPLELLPLSSSRLANICCCSGSAGGIMKCNKSHSNFRIWSIHDWDFVPLSFSQCVCLVGRSSPSPSSSAVAAAIYSDSTGLTRCK